MVGIWSWILTLSPSPALTPVLSFPPGRSRSLRLKLLALTGSRQSLPPEPPDVVVVDPGVVDPLAMDPALPGSDSGPEDASSSLEPGDGDRPEDEAALMGDPEPPMTQSSPRAERLALAFANHSLARSRSQERRSRESLRSLRRASSVDDIEAMKGDGDKRCHSRHTSASAGLHRGSSTGTAIPARGTVISAGDIGAATARDPGDPPSHLLRAVPGAGRGWGPPHHHQDPHSPSCSPLFPPVPSATLSHSVESPWESPWESPRESPCWPQSSLSALR